MAIPMMLAAGPLVGYFAGCWLDRRLATDPWLTVSGALLGFAAAVKETIRIIRILQREQEHGD
jgi:F0F1-type ATP synthase assembly protein I